MLHVSQSLGDEDPDGTWSRVADAVAEMQERISADGMQEISRAELAAGIRDAIEKLVEGGIAGDSLAVEFGQSPDVDSISQAVIKPAT